jgi:transposase-like protein
MVCLRPRLRVNKRNGSRPQTLSTKAGDIDLRILKPRKGSFFPLILEPLLRIDQAFVRGADGGLRRRVATSSVDYLVAAWGIGSGISTSEVRRSRADLDEVVTDAHQT